MTYSFIINILWLILTIKYQDNQDHLSRGTLASPDNQDHQGHQVFLEGHPSQHNQASLDPQVDLEDHLSQDSHASLVVLPHHL